jgi:hypothetical protein
VTFLLYMVADANRRGYRHLIDAFWDEARSFDLALPCEQPVSAPALCKARRKITSELLRTLLHRVADAFDGRFGERNRFLGRRVFAVDGTKVNLQRSYELKHAFGVPAGGHCPQAMVSTLFDLVAKVPHDVVVAPNASCERQQMVLLLDRLRPGDVLVLDRGYPSFEVLRILLDAGIDFVIRVPRSSFAALDDLILGGSDDRRIRIQPPKDGPLRSQDPICVRALRVARPGSRPTILLTSLSRNEFSLPSVAELYRMRWEVEEFYKLQVSNYFAQGFFHGRSVRGVEQEIYAQMLFVAITRHLMAAVAEAAELPYEHVSQKGAILAVGDHLTRLVLAQPPERAVDHLRLLLERIDRCQATP